ncbi:helix-turn-helix transcriptional regulator [Mycoplasmatota bacterium WC44]
MLKSKNEIGELIRNFRIRNSMTQNELAQKLNVSNSAVSNWENGETNIDIDLLDKLADLMKITIDELIRKQEYNDDYFIYEVMNFNGLEI